MVAPANQPLGQVGEFDPADIDPAPGNRIVPPSGVEDLLGTMGDPKIGQKQPGVIYENPNPPKSYLCAAGNRRLMACRILGLKFKAFLVPGPVTRLDLIKIRLTENVLRKAMSPLEIAADIEDYIKLANCTQAEAAERFGYSPAQISKLLSLKNLDPSLRPLVDAGKLCGDVARLIATLPTPEAQKALAEDTIAGNWTREQVVREAAIRKGFKRVPKPKDRRLKFGPLLLTAPGDWLNAKLVDALNDVIKQLRKE